MRNIHIANTHRTYRKFVGHVVAQSALLAFIANTIVVPAGLIVMALTVASGNWIGLTVTIIVVLLIGILLALIADGMTLGACARIRLSLEKSKLIKTEYARVPENEKSESVRKREKQELALLNPSYFVNGLCIFFFGSVSASAGTLFWHRLLETLPIWQAWTFSTLFSVLITGTLIACEIFKVQNNEVVREAIVTDHFTNEALLEDMNELALGLLHAKSKTEVEKIADNTDTVRISVEEHAQSVYDNLLAGGKGLIPARIRREKADKEAARLQEIAETDRQFRLIKGGQEMVVQTERNTGPIAQVSPSRAGGTNYQKICSLYERFGEDYIKENIDDIALETGMSASTIYRHLSKCLKENAM
jgi:hypothetical protein